MSAYKCCGEYDEHAPNCITVEYKKAQDEIEKLKKKLEIAVEALNKYAVNHMELYGYLGLEEEKDCYALEALKEIGEIEL